MKTSTKFISQIIQKLNEVNPQDWENYTNFSFDFPKNAISKRKYKGINIFTLLLFDIFPKNRLNFNYATFHQITTRGGKLRKGSKGIPIEFFTKSAKHKETGKNISYTDFMNLSTAAQQNYTLVQGLKHYTVFNIADIENIEEINFAKIDGEEDFNEIEEVLNGENLINSLIADKNLILEYRKTAVASYSPSRDKITLPEKKYFLSTAKYYSTAFHEIIHWTGHESRLNRNFEGSKNSEKYAFEELVAEMGSILLNFEIGILEEFTNSVRYLKGWLKNTPPEEQEKRLSDALFLSKKAVKFILQN